MINLPPRLAQGVDDTDTASLPSTSDLLHVGPARFLDQTPPIGTIGLPIPPHPHYTLIGNWSHTLGHTNRRLRNLGVQYLGRLTDNDADYWSNIGLVRTQNCSYYSDIPLQLNDILNTFTIRDLAQEFLLLPSCPSYSTATFETTRCAQVVITITTSLLSIVLIVDLVGWECPMASPTTAFVPRSVIEPFPMCRRNYAIHVGSHALDHPGLLGQAISALTFRCFSSADFRMRPHRTLILALRPSRSNPRSLQLISRVGEYQQWPLFTRLPAHITDDLNSAAFLAHWPEVNPIQQIVIPPRNQWLPQRAVLQHIMTTPPEPVPPHNPLPAGYSVSNVYFTAHQFCGVSVSLAVGYYSGIVEAHVLPSVPHSPPWILRDVQAVRCLIRCHGAYRVLDRLARLNDVLNLWSLNDLMYLPQEEPRPPLNVLSRANVNVIITTPYSITLLIVSLRYGNGQFLPLTPPFTRHITNTSPYSNICSLGTAYLPGFLRHTTTNLRAIHDQQGYPFPSSCNFQAYLITRHAPSWLRVSSWLPREIDPDTGWERDLPIPFLISEHNTHVDPVPDSL